jgi:hypothetical protein
VRTVQKLENDQAYHSDSHLLLQADFDGSRLLRQPRVVIENADFTGMKRKGANS